MWEKHCLFPDTALTACSAGSYYGTGAEPAGRPQLMWPTGLCQRAPRDTAVTAGRALHTWFHVTRAHKSSHSY